MGGEDTRARGVVKAPQDLAGGMFMVAVAVASAWLGRELPAGTLGGMGPGMLPRSVAVLLGLLGAALAVSAFFEAGPRLGTWSIRGAVFVVGAILVFAFTVRPLGLVVAAPLAIIVSGLASAETRWGETLIFGAGMTAFCIGLFKYALNLPIPLAPWLLGY